MAGAKNHDYHLVEPDPWPLIGAASGGLFFGGFVMWLHANPYGKFVMALGMLGVLVTMFNWWSNTIREAHAGEAEDHQRYAEAVGVEPHDGPAEHDAAGDGADQWPGIRLNQMIIVVLRSGHLVLLPSSPLLRL
jgi:hypothetical protein